MKSWLKNSSYYNNNLVLCHTVAIQFNLLLLRKSLIFREDTRKYNLQGVKLDDEEVIYFGEDVVTETDVVVIVVVGVVAEDNNSYSNNIVRTNRDLGHMFRNGSYIVC